tara:strand:+ start:1683 stop:3587 length:1905 start_codon:yes stop_codon:yes gene_type:complete
MRLKPIVALILFVISPYIFCQENSLTIDKIPIDLIENSNSVVRNEQITVEIEAVDKMTVYTKRTVTILNKLGEGHDSSIQWYDDNSKIKEQFAIIFNASGEEIKKIKQKDFKDVSAVSSNDLFSDNRISYLDYTPTEYPYTVEYNSEVVSNSTIFIQPWKPIHRYSQSVQLSSYKLVNPENIPLRLKETNFISSIKKKNSETLLEYSATNIPAYRYEYLSPELSEFTPLAKVALKDFSLVGVLGSADNWKEFGKWQYDNLLKGRNELSKETILEVSALTKDVQDPIEKARLIYEYVQAKTRYISIQLGIGGWIPMKAKEVDELGYGDCKALTNYTYSLLESQGIESYYTIVHAGEDKKDFDPEFAVMQGNHVILTIPQEGENVFLECTSQTMPFNYLGDFTDNRNVLILKPDGGEVIRTKKYEFNENVQVNSIELFLGPKGDFKGNITKISKGIEYGNSYGLERSNLKDQKRYYRDSFRHLKNLEIDSLSYINNRKDKIFEEKMAVSGTNFGTIAGKRLLIQLSIFNLETEDTPRYLERKHPLEIPRGKTISNKILLNIPEGYKVENIPESEEIENQFGSFKMETKVENNNIIVAQTYILKDGLWEKEAYEDFREFLIQIKSYSNQKAVIIATN